MRKSLLPFLCYAYLIALLVTGCQKATEIEPTSRDQIEAERRGGHREECRLVNFIWDNNSSEFFHYNRKGLLDEWRAEGNGGAAFSVRFTMEYDHKDRLIKAKTYNGDVLLDEGFFKYKDGKIVTENWYSAASGDLYATTNITYNHRGWIVKKDDIINQYYVTFKYDAMGNNTENDVVGYDGTIYVRFINEFEKPVRNAYTAVKGIPYPFFWFNAVFSPRQETAIDVFIPDENGVLQPLFDRSSDKSILVANKYKLPAFQNHYDFVSNRWDRQVWNYENCDGKCDVPTWWANDRPSYDRPAAQNKYAKFGRPIPRMDIANLKAELEVLRKK